MNWTEMSADWTMFSPMLVTWWKRLQADDLRQIDGSRQKLAEVLCERYGFPADEAERQIRAFEKEVRRPGAVK